MIRTVLGSFSFKTHQKHILANQKYYFRRAGDRKTASGSRFCSSMPLSLENGAHRICKSTVFVDPAIAKVLFLSIRRSQKYCNRRPGVCKLAMITEDL